MNKRYVFYISDSTGITAQTLGQSVLSQFEGVEFEETVIPFVDSVESANAAYQRINRIAEQTQLTPIIFDTVIEPELNAILSKVKGKRFDVLNTYVNPLEQEFEFSSSHKVGKAHGATDEKQYMNRIDAVHFAMENDDGGKTRYYDQADVILVGVSRCGKTPTSLYLALQFGIFTANYPITDDDIGDLSLPRALREYKDKLFGLTIDPERLSLIRNERRSNSHYSSLRQCVKEVNDVEAIYRRLRIPFINTTTFSIEEIASKILNVTGIERKI